MPENWKILELGDYIEYQKGFAFKSKWYQNTGALIVRVSDTTDNSVDISTCHKIDFSLAENYSKYKIFSTDVVIATVGSWPPNYSSVVGKVIKVPKTADEALLNQNAVRLRTNSENSFNQSFLYYLMKTPTFLNYIVNCAQGSASQASIKLTDIFNYKFALPLIEEQKSITSILSALDDKIELNLQINKTLEEMAMALYKHWFVDFGPFQDGEFVVSELGEIPKGWEVKGILELTDLLSGGTPKTKIAEYWDGTVNWVSAKDIGNGGNIYISDTEKKITEKGVENSSTKILPSDTVILVARGSVGKFGMIAKPMAMNQSCYGLFSKGEYSQGLVYLMCSNLIEQFKRVSYGSVFDTITTSTFKSTKVVSPPSAVIKELKGLIDPLFLELKNNILENKTLTKLRDTLLPKLISGEVRIKNAEKILSEIL